MFEKNGTYFKNTRSRIKNVAEGKAQKRAFLMDMKILPFEVGVSWTNKWKRPICLLIFTECLIFKINCDCLGINMLLLFRTRQLTLPHIHYSYTVRIISTSAFAFCELVSTTFCFANRYSEPSMQARHGERACNIDQRVIDICVGLVDTRWLR